MTQAHDEQPQGLEVPGGTDAVTVAFGDLAADVFGVARLGLSATADGGRQASGLALLFTGGKPVAVQAAGGLELGAQDASPTAAGVHLETVEPLRRWAVEFSAEDGVHGFALELEALAAPGGVAAGEPVAKAGGMQGYDQPVRVTGRARVRGGERRIEGLGQRGHAWGAPDWDRIALTRSVSAWLGADLAVSAAAVRATKVVNHGDEAVAATVFTPTGDGPVEPVAQEDVRLTTEYDEEGRQRRAGLELYADEEAYPLRAAGEVLCGTSLDLGRLRLDCAFLAWRGDGRLGVGRYDVLRRVG